jgi:Flp pilus assembly pilin Flp
MKTAIALFAAALSVAAFSTNASAQQLIATQVQAPFYLKSSPTQVQSPCQTTQVQSPFQTTQVQSPFQTTAFPTEEWMPSVKPAANTSFGSRSGGGFKLVSQSADIAVEKAMNSGSSDENIAAAACTTPVNDALIAVVIIAAVDADSCPKSPASNASLAVEKEQAAIPAFVAGEGEPQAATAEDYALIASLIGIAVTGGEADEHGETGPAAATAIEYGLIASLTSNGPDVIDTVYAEAEFE